MQRVFDRALGVAPWAIVIRTQSGAWKRLGDAHARIRPWIKALFERYFTRQR